MDNLEAHGNGFGGRVDGPLFDSRHILMPGSMLMGTLGEAAQNDVQQNQEAGIPLPEQSGFVGKTLELVGTMPLDAKAVGLGCAAAAAVTLVHTARTYRDINVENSIIGAGLSRESAVPSLARRAVKRVAAVAIAGAAAYGAYKAGTHLSAEQAITADVGTMGTGVGYLMYMKRRMTGKW